MPSSSTPTHPTLPEALRQHFFQTPLGVWQAQFESSLAATLVEQDLAEAGVTYRTTIVKSKKRGLLYVIVLPEQAVRAAA
jgi:hypothetical protein